MHWFILCMEIIGTAAFAISGAITGIRKNMDIFGVCVMGITTATGGGALRDIILGVNPPLCFVNPKYVLMALAVSVAVFVLFCRKMIHENSKVYEIALLLSDSAGLGIFTVCGANAAIDSGLCDNIFPMILVAVITGVGGGVLRDIFAGDRPYIFVKHIYACASLAGVILYLLADNIISRNLNMILCVVFIFAVRICSARFRWSLPKIKFDEQK